MKTINEMHKDMALERLNYFRGNKCAAAISLGIAVKTLHNWIERYGFKPPYHRPIENHTRDEFNLPTGKTNAQ